MEITSRGNKSFKVLSKLTDKKWRRELGLCVIEGEKIVADNIDKAEQVYIRKSRVDLAGGDLSVVLTGARDDVLKKVAVLQDFLFDEVSSLENDTGVLAVVKIPQPQNLTFPFLVLDGVQDAGNAGTLLRTASAFGFGTVFCVNCVDVWSQKVLRASSGTNFLVNIIQTSKFTKPPNCFLVGADLNCREDLSACLGRKNLGIVLGNEGRGLSKELRCLVDEFVTIPMQAGVESLNVSAAGAILMYLSRTG